MNTITPSSAYKPLAELAIPAGVELLHLSPTIGTEVLGVRLRDVDGPMKAFLHSLLLERKVIFFRDQQLTPAEHVAFGRLWGELDILPAVDEVPGHPEIIEVLRDGETQPGEATGWHSDITWRALPPMGSVLVGRTIPPVGGDTLFCDMYEAYERMPAWLKRAVDDMSAIHSIDNAYGPRLAADRRAEFEEKYPPQLHPVIRTHPETGRRLIFVNEAHTLRIKGVSKADSELLLRRLYAQSRIPDYQCRFRWRENSVAFWDNRACQHYGLSDFRPHKRHMQRVTIIGDKPF